MNQKLSSVKAIKTYFPDVKMAELKALNADEREEMGRLCCQAIGCQHEILDRDENAAKILERQAS